MKQVQEGRLQDPVLIDGSSATLSGSLSIERSEAVVYFSVGVPGRSSRRVDSDSEGTVLGAVRTVLGAGCLL